MAVRHGVEDTDKHFIIDPVTRNIRNESGKLILIQYDHNSERFTFECPRNVDEHDMSLCNRVEIHYINTGTGNARSTGVYEVRDLQVAQDTNNVVTCSWLISQNSTQHVGKLNFVIRFACIAEDGTIEYAWNTNIYSDIVIAKGIYNGDQFVEDYVDLLEAWKQDLYSVGLKISSVEQTVTSNEDDGVNVVTMTMTDDSKNTFQIKNGSKGSPGVSVTHEWEGTTLKVTSASGTSSADLKGPKGDPGVDVTHEWDGTTLKVTSASGTSSADLKGEKGDRGTDVTHEWDGTTLKVTSASGTSSADLKGAKGDKGDAGTHIVKIERTAGNGAPGTIDTYTVTTNDDTTFTFDVYNGADGLGVGDMLKNVYDPQNKNTDVFAYVDEKIETSAVQGDWNQNDSSEPDYVKNRPFYTSDPIETTYVDNVTINFANDGDVLINPFSVELVEGRDYKVVWNGVECITTCNRFDGFLAIGNHTLAGPGTNTGEPFLIFLQGVEYTVFSSILGDITVTIAGLVVDVKKIDEKYLPAFVGKNVGNDAEIFNDYKNNNAIGDGSHAEGGYTKANGDYSHAEGFNTESMGDYSHAEGRGTRATGNFSHVQGQYNVEDTTKNLMHIVGNGSSSKRSNAHTVSKTGEAWFAGDVYVGSTSGVNKDEGSKKLVTDTYVDEAIHTGGITTAGNGAAYTATVPGITTLTAGVSFVMIPHAASTTKTPTLNVNGLGAKSIKRQTSNVSSTLANGYADSWLSKGTPVHVIYNGTYWIIQGMSQTNPYDLSAAVPVTKGGTGATSAADARSNLGAISADDFVTLLTTALADSPDITIKNVDGTIYLSMGEAGFVVVNGSKIASVTHDTIQFVGVKGKISGLGTPTADDQAATKKYVDDIDNSATQRLQSEATAIRNEMDAITPDTIGAAKASHNQSASTITSGTFNGAVHANENIAGTVGIAQLRDIYAGTSDMVAGSTSLKSGTIYLVYE